MHPKYPVRRILIKRDARVDCWVAQCVDFDVVAQARTLEDLPKAFGHVYYGEILVAMEKGESVFFPPVPDEVLVEWAQVEMKPGGVRSRVWSDFVPGWWFRACGELAKMQEAASPKQEVELRQPLAAAA